VKIQARVTIAGRHLCRERPPWRSVACESTSPGILRNATNRAGVCPGPLRPLFSFLALIGLLFASTAVADEEQANYDLHEFSILGLDPTLEQANELQHYPSAMPGAVETDRSRANDSRKLTPLAIVTLHGEPVKDLEIDLRVQSGRFVAHWPPAESKSGRLRWLELATLADQDKDALFASVDEKHWFVQARQLDALFVKDKSRSERFLTYDCELKYEVPVQVAGGPETYLITNSSKHPLLDLFVLSPQDGGMRIGHLESLPPSKPKAASKVAKTDEPTDGGKPVDKNAADKKDVKPSEAKPVPTTVAPVTVAAPAIAVPGQVAPVPGAVPAAKPAAAPAVALEPTELAMSPVLALDSDEYRVVRETLAASLLKLGLTQQEVDLLFDRAGAALFETKEMIVVFRLPAEALEERLPLVAYPAPRKTVRTALVLVRNLDPKIKDEVEKLIADLGSPEYTLREEAEKRLTELGRLAMPALKQSLKSSDLEIVFRAERILLAQNEKLDGT
jgi:hypothetical protein